MLAIDAVILKHDSRLSVLDLCKQVGTCLSMSKLEG